LERKYENIYDVWVEQGTYTQRCTPNYQSMASQLAIPHSYPRITRRSVLVLRPMAV